ncbi:CinA family protein [Candidatus Kuenenia stuttgartensis]
MSPQVAEAMAKGARKVSEASIGIGITGIAGPGGGTDKKTRRTGLHCNYR